MIEQKDYYEKTAADYDLMHLGASEHDFSLSLLIGLMRHYAFASLLDVGAGTGRVIRQAQSHLVDVNIHGVEPVEGLRKIAYEHGVHPEKLVAGDARSLPYDDDSWDIVCAFGILHHIPDPNRAVEEMCRVAKHGIFISDLNNFGCGSFIQRLLSNSLRIVGLWRSFQFIKNGGKYEKFSEGDGVHYSYSVFDSLPLLKRKFPQVHLVNTKGTGTSLKYNCSHVALFAVLASDALASRRTNKGRTGNTGLA